MIYVHIRKESGNRRVQFHDGSILEFDDQSYIEMWDLPKNWFSVTVHRRADAHP